MLLEKREPSLFWWVARAFIYNIKDKERSFKHKQAWKNLLTKKREKHLSLSLSSEREQKYEIYNAKRITHTQRRRKKKKHPKFTRENSSNSATAFCLSIQACNIAIA